MPRWFLCLFVFRVSCSASFRRPARCIGGGARGPPHGSLLQQCPARCVLLSVSTLAPSSKGCLRSTPTMGARAWRLGRVTCPLGYRCSIDVTAARRRRRHDACAVLARFTWSGGEQDVASFRSQLPVLLRTATAAACAAAPLAQVRLLALLGHVIGGGDANLRCAPAASAPPPGKGGGGSVYHRQRQILIAPATNRVRVSVPLCSCSQ